MVATFGLEPDALQGHFDQQLPAKVAREVCNTSLQIKTTSYAGKKPKRTTGVEPATFGLGSRRSTN